MPVVPLLRAKRYAMQALGAIENPSRLQYAKLDYKMKD